MHRGGSPQLLSSGSTLTWGLKTKNNYGGSFLTSITSFTNATTILSENQTDLDFYYGIFSLNTAAITNTLGDSDVSFDVLGELQIDVGGGGQAFSSLTVPITIYNDIVRGGEGAVSPSDPDYVAQQEIIRWKSSGATPAVSSLLGNGSADFDAIVTTTLTEGTLEALIDEDVSDVFRYYRLESGVLTEITTTFDNSTNTVTSTSHGFSDTNRIQFYGGTLPAELSFNTVYFVRDKTTNTYAVAATSGGSAIAFTDDGSGTTTVMLLNDPDVIRPTDYHASTNAFSWVQYGPTVSDAAVEASYNSQVAAMSQAEAEAGTSTAIRRITAERVKQAIVALQTPIQRYVDFSIPAAAWTPAASDGADPAVTVYSGNDIDTKAFDKDTEEACYVTFQLPEDYNGGVLRWRVDWDALATASGTAVWGLSGGAYGNSDALSTSLGSERTISDTLLSVGDMHKSPNDATGITLAGTPLAGEFVILKIVLKTSSTIAVDVLGLNLQLQYQTKTTFPSVWA